LLLSFQGGTTGFDTNRMRAIASPDTGPVPRPQAAPRGVALDLVSARDYGNTMASADEELDEAPEGAADDGDDDGDEPERERRRRRLERILPDLVRRAIEKGLETGLGTLSNGGEAIRDILGDNVKHVPRELAGYVFSQVDETKNAVVRVVAREVRDFLAATDLAHELQKALTSLSFEIRTEIRFVPNEAGGVRPEVRAELDPKVSPRKRRKARDPEPEADLDEET
jgi:hypothetical protein